MANSIQDFADLVRVTARLQDVLVHLDPRSEEVADCTRILDRVVGRLEALPVVSPTDDPVALALSGPHFPARARALVPERTVAKSGTDWEKGTTIFRPHFGGRGAVHGGALALFFDDVLGGLANETGSRMSRTAYLHVEFKRTVPVDRVLEYGARVDRVEGRKLFLECELRLEGDVLTTASGLWVQLRDSVATAPAR